MTITIALPLCHPETTISAELALQDLNLDNLVMGPANNGTLDSEVRKYKPYLIDFGNSLVLPLGPGKQGPIELPSSVVDHFEGVSRFDPYAWDVYCTGLLFARIVEVSSLHCSVVAQICT